MSVRLAQCRSTCVRVGRSGCPLTPTRQIQGGSDQAIESFLGIELDTEAGIARLPQEKLERLLAEIRRWAGRHSCTKIKLLLLIGQLQHACCVVKPGRTFLRNIIMI